MALLRHVKPNFPADAFAGTATYYARYRVPYPTVLLNDLVERAGVTGEVSRQVFRSLEVPARFCSTARTPVTSTQSSGVSAR